MLLLAAAFLGGCTVSGPNHTAPELTLPARWSTGDGATPAVSRADPAALAQWWRQLGDPQLDRLIETALAEGKDLRLAQARLRQARAVRAQAEGATLPTVGASTSLSRSAAANPAGGAAPQSRTLYNLGFDANWEIDLFGGLARGVEAAGADLAASTASLQGVQVSLVAEVAQNYVDLRSYQQRLAIARDNLAAQSETLQITEWRNQAGLTDSSVVEQARANREQTRAGIPDLELGLSNAEHRLAVLLGRPPGALHAELAAVRPLPDVPATVAAGIPADTLRQRPDLIAAERTLAAETARVGQQLAQRFPSLSLGGSFGWQAYSLGALGSAATLARAVSGSLAATLFDGGRLRNAVEVRSAVQEQALISYESSVLTALEEVENALAAHAAARERIAARRAAAEAARNAAQLSRRMYESGLTDFQKLLETERTRLSAEDSLASAEAIQVASVIKLYKALGGGWSLPATTPVPLTVESGKP